MACHKVCQLYIVGRFDGLVTEAQMRDRYAPGFFGIILEISLYIFIRMIADDLDGVFVGTYGTVCAQAPEFAGFRSLGSHIRIGGDRQGQMRHIIVDG